MLGLAGYASSDDEDGEDKKQDENVKTNHELQIARESKDNVAILPTPMANSTFAQKHSGKDLDTSDVASRSGIPAGPIAGPTMPPSDHTELMEDASEYLLDNDTSSREAVRNLTMPPYPNFDIPPSPPGSPPLAATKKFAHFLKIKKQGIHFNERLESTPALKNPTLFEKLKKHAGVGDEDQYATTLRAELAVPVSFPPWSYGEVLNQSQALRRQRLEEEGKKRPREAIDFVPATSSRTPDRTKAAKTSGESLSERIISGRNGSR